MSNLVLSGIRVVVFDLDDTLYPERAFAYSGFDAVSVWLKARLPCPMDPARRMRELFETGHRGHVFDRLLEEMGTGAEASRVAQMIDCYRTHRPTIELFEDARRALERWRGRFSTGLISDGPLKMQENKIRALALASAIDTIILTDQWGPQYWKPHPRAFMAIEDAFRADGRVCVYLADNASKDFLAPRSRGWRTIQIRRPDTVHSHLSAVIDGEPDATVASLDEIDITT